MKVQYQMKWDADQSLDRGCRRGGLAGQWGFQWIIEQAPHKLCNPDGPDKYILGQGHTEA